MLCVDVVLLIVFKLSVFMLDVVLMRFLYAESNCAKYGNAESHNAQFKYARSHGATLFARNSAD